MPATRLFGSGRRCARDGRDGRRNSCRDACHRVEQHGVHARAGLHGDAVPEDEGRHLAHVLDRNDVAAVQTRARLGRHDEMDHGARAHAEVDAGKLPRASADGDDVPADGLGNVGVLELLSRLVEADDTEEGADLAEHVGGDALVREVEHRELRFRVGVVELDLEEKAVELAFGEGEDAFVLVRVLGRDDEKRIGELVRLAVDGDLALPHRLESAAWVRGGVRLISSARRTFVKTAPGMNRCSPARMTFCPFSSTGVVSGVN